MPSQHRQLAAFLDALFPPETGDGFVELRSRRGFGMRQHFFPRDAQQDAARRILGLGGHTDVYIGVGLRGYSAGGRGAIRELWTLWADCDGADAVTALESFEPEPAIVVRSGPDGVHAYWLLSEAVQPDAAEAANRHLAHSLGADGRSTDAARILRPPVTRNFKYRPPSPVVIEHFEPTRIPPTALQLPAADAARAIRIEPAPADEDPLRQIEPAVYISVLLSTPVRPGSKVHCPFHGDRTPSLHVYPTPEAGWYCYGCGRGGSVYDFAGAFWGVGTRGREFPQLRARLLRAFDLAA